MKRIVAFVLVAAALAVPATQASAAGPSAAQFRALQVQVTSLQAQVKAIQKWVPKSCSARTCFTLPLLSGTVAFNYETEICQQAVIADEFQGTWSVIDQLSSATQAGKIYFGAQSPITDAGSCSNVRITRATVIPPNVAIFSSLVALLTG